MTKYRTPNPHILTVVRIHARRPPHSNSYIAISLLALSLYGLLFRFNCLDEFVIALAFVTTTVVNVAATAAALTFNNANVTLVNRVQSTPKAFKHFSLAIVLYISGNLHFGQ